MTFKSRQKIEIAVIAAIVFFLLSLVVMCGKEEIVDLKPSNDSAEALKQPYITHGNEIGLIESNGVLMSFKDEGIVNFADVRLPQFMLIQPYTSTRSIYLDGADTIYNNASGRAVFAKYCKDNRFDEVHFYKMSNILSSGVNYANLQTFNKLLYDNGVKKRIAVLGSSSTTNFNSYYNATTDTTKRLNGINLENEWWNSTTTFSNWINQVNTLNVYCDSKTPDLSNSFYMGWYNNLGGITDSIAARQQLQVVDWIDLHCYRNNKLDYGYTKTRLEAIAKAAKSLNKVAIVNIIASTEQIAWGASNDFDGYYLQSLGYVGFEKKYIDDFNANASTNVKSWIKINKFKYFTKRYNYKAILPR